MMDKRRERLGGYGARPFFSIRMVLVRATSTAGDEQRAQGTRTARKRTRFSIILVKASSALCRGNFSMRGRMLESALKAIVSSESIALPLGDPAIDLPLSI